MRKPLTTVGSNKRLYAMMLYVTAEERDYIEKQAKVAGRSLNDHLRSQVLPKDGISSKRTTS